MAAPDQAPPPDQGGADEVEEYRSLLDHIHQVIQIPSVNEQERAVLMTCAQNIQKLLAQNEKMEEQAGANPVLRKLIPGA